MILSIRKRACQSPFTRASFLKLICCCFPLLHHLLNNFQFQIYSSCVPFNFKYLSFVSLLTSQYSQRYRQLPTAAWIPSPLMPFSFSLLVDYIEFRNLLLYMPHLLFFPKGSAPQVDTYNRFSYMVANISKLPSLFLLTFPLNLQFRNDWCFSYFNSRAI